MARRRKVNAKFIVFNVKLRSNERSGPQAYVELFRTLFANKIVGTPKRGNSMILRTQFSTEIDGNVILYGKISRFTTLDTIDWLDLNNLERSQFELPPNLFPNLKETDYYFIPQTHRFCIRLQSGITSVFQVEEFLQNALARSRTETEQIEVTVYQSSDMIERILNAPKLKRLEVQISYTNNDLNSRSAEVVDRILRNMNASRFDAKITSDHNEELNLENEFLKGAVELSQSNGKSIATIINDQDQTEKIITRDHPEVIQVTAIGEDNLMLELTRRIMSIFRP